VYGKHIVKGTGLRAGRDSMHHLQVFAWHRHPITYQSGRLFLTNQPPVLPPIIDRLQ
jgi:hypothetical protein